VNFFIWIVIKNYWCDIKSEKSGNVLMLIVGGKKKRMNSTVLFCIQSNKAIKKNVNVFYLTFLGEVKKIEGEWELFAKQPQRFWVLDPFRG
jgi:hypothetical protein